MHRPILVGIKVEAAFQWVDEQDELAPEGTIITQQYHSLTQFATAAAAALREAWEHLKETGPPADSLPGEGGIPQPHGEQEG